MKRLRAFFLHPITLAVLAVIIVACLFLLGSNTLKVIALFLGFLLAIVFIVLITLWVNKRLQTRKSAKEFTKALFGFGEKKAEDGDIKVLRERMRHAVKSIKTSRLGQAKGTEALYELPWYMIIGNPAAGKSTAIANSGLHFPFAEEHGTIIQGIGGTRNCDWYFTSEGIILDTAGRYSVHEENRDEWKGFLKLLRRHRPRAPINGIIIAASIAELTSNRPEFAIDLAKKLRNRVQELTEELEVVAPVYIIFTKADLIAGFNGFFDSLEDEERKRVWGATLPFRTDGDVDIITEFDNHFDELSAGLKEMSLANMAMQQSQEVAPGTLTLPLEFASIKTVLRTFVSTLFEDNPYQHRPVFRGFYFTSALQEEAAVHTASDQITKRFHLSQPTASEGTHQPSGNSQSFFLLKLFRRVIFADKGLVRQYSSKGRKRSRYAMLLASAIGLSLIMGGWAWSYTNNRQLVADVQQDLQQAIAVQNGRVDLAPRLKALLILQNRIQQLQAYGKDHPVLTTLGLYQGNDLATRLRQEYFQGMQQIMLSPVVANLQGYLDKVVANQDKLHIVKGDDEQADDTSSTQRYQTPSPTNTQSAYNALRAYLMLSQPKRVEPVQLSGQLTRFWRNWLNANRGMMDRDQLISSAQQLMTFYVAQYQQPAWPTIQPRVTLVENTRSALRHVMRGMSAVDRVYTEIKARAATRYPALTVASILHKKANALLQGSYTVPGPFTEEAWSGYIKDAFKNAAYNELSVTDWVLESNRKADLTLLGSPKQIQQQLTDKYNHEYVQHWQKFLSGVSVKRFASLDAAISGMNRLGDSANSPLRKLLTRVYHETSWDNPVSVASNLKSPDSGLMAWFKQRFIQRVDAAEKVNEGFEHADTGGGPTLGPIGASFTGIGQLMQDGKNKSSLFDSYMAMLGKLRAGLNSITTAGSANKGARNLMAATLAGNQSQLTAGLHLVDQQLLNGIDPLQRKTLRPLLLRPLIQTFRALIKPTETSLNRAWVAQVLKPFQNNLADKYPFNPRANVQATAAEISQIFGPGGAIARFVKKDLGPLVNQLGNTLTAKQWAGMGITLSPAIMANYGLWTSPPNMAANSTGDNRQLFKILPMPATQGISGYSINIDGQKLLYRNTPPEWKPFVWGIPHKTHIVELKATGLSGQTVTIEKFTGNKALPSWFASADSSLNKDTGVYTLAWSKGPMAVSVKMKLIKSGNLNAKGIPQKGLRGTQLPQFVAGGMPGIATTQPQQGKDNS